MHSDLISTTAKAIAQTYTSGNQLIDIAGQSAKEASQSKNGICREKTSLATKDITQFAVQRLEGSQSQEVGSRDPTGQVESLQVATDLTITGHDDCLVGSGEEDLRVED